ncbi:MAG: carboxypeptidase regulatory-like domain-containing protein, partial [Candidatus Cloacimonetes bacterium]|nr:carboxypeptidase regulatory-like domain-containing protein [Candidatus Cloacimonadota bacterium]
MKKLFIFISMILPWLLCSTVIPAGDVSGLWDLTGSPYYIDGEITLQAGEELLIEAGVDVIFNDHYQFIIHGRIMANGTVSDSIRFMPLDPNTGWHSLRFIDGNLSSLPANEISYCEFWQGFALGAGDESNGGAIFCSNTGNLSISNSSFYENYAQFDGGAIYLEADSDVEIDNCLFQLNNCGFYGGGMIAYDSDPVLNGCVFYDNNSAVFAAGFSSWDQSNPELYNCVFIENTAGACTGIYCVSSTIKMANVLFRDNSTTFGSGAACGLTNCVTDVSNVTAVDNISPLSGGAFWVNGGSLNVYNSILWNNLPENIFVLSGAANAFNSCISDDFTGPGVISDNPQFLDFNGDNYHLAEISPCIDTGDESIVTFPLPEYDLDGNIRIVDGDNNGTATIDMGVYEFTPEAPNGFIAGTVTDGEGSFLENAEITAGEYTTVTDANGEYAIEVVAGDYTVTCYLEGYEVPDGVEVTVIAGETV